MYEAIVNRIETQGGIEYQVWKSRSLVIRYENLRDFAHVE